VSFRLSSSRIILAVAVAVLAGALGMSALPSADAQEPPPTVVGVLSNFPVAASNGFSNLPEFSGSGDGVVGAACTGATPRSGTPNIPGQVVTELRQDLTYLRIMRNDGLPITGTVRINCVLEVEATPEGNAVLDRLQQAAS
jgi:hypothetical protein